MNVDNLNFDADTVPDPSQLALAEAEQEAGEIEEEPEVSVDRSPRWLSILANHDILSKDEINRLARRAHMKKPDRAAYDRIIRHHLRFVLKFAFKYARGCKHLSVEDLFQEGVLGLMRALDKFKPELGWCFITYASYWVRQSMQRAIADKERNIRRPVHVQEKLTRLRRLGAITDEDARVGKGGLTSEQVALVRSTQALHTVSLDAPIKDVDGLTFADIVSSSDSPVDYGIHVQETVSALAAIPTRERKVFLTRLSGEKTLKAIGRVVRRSRERIRQIEAQAMRLMRLELQRPQHERLLFPEALRIVKRDIAELFPKRKKGAPALAVLSLEFLPRWVRSAKKSKKSGKKNKAPNRKKRAPCRAPRK